MIVELLNPVCDLTGLTITCLILVAILIVIIFKR